VTEAPSMNADAVRMFHEALAMQQKGDYNQAFQFLIAAVATDASLAGAWNNLGMVLHRLQKFESAVAAFYKSHILAPQSALPLANYAWALQLAGRCEEALDLVLTKVIPTDPENSLHYANLAQVYLTLNRIDDAVDAAYRAKDMGNDSADAKFVLALAQLRKGNFYDGLRNYEARMDINPVLAMLKNHPYPVWRGEDISNKRLFIPCEQGLGDSIMFLPFIIEAAKRAGSVIVQTHTPALKFYQKNLRLPNVKVFPVPHELPSDADYFCPSLSLPIALNITSKEIPKTLRKLRFAPTYFTGFNAPKTPKELRIGIAWAGDPSHDNDRYRSANLPAFMRLCEIPGAKLYSLQIGPRKGDLDIYGAHGSVKDMAPFIRDANDTAAFIAQHLDLVVTVDTAVAHIAGAVGAETYLLHGARSVDWRWGEGGGQSIWYPNTTMLRQKVNGDWIEIIDRVKYLIVKSL
jgi:tetratricopeptide (TPR) repeat protein